MVAALLPSILQEGGEGEEEEHPRSSILPVAAGEVECLAFPRLLAAVAVVVVVVVVHRAFDQAKVGEGGVEGGELPHLQSSPSQLWGWSPSFQSR